MLLIDRTLLKLSKGLWKWIILIVLVRFISLWALSEFAFVIGMYLGNVFSPVYDPLLLQMAVKGAFGAALIRFIFQLLQGEAEHRCSMAARESMRSRIFAKVLELDAGNIEKIGPVSAVTSSVDAVESIQVYYSTYLPSLFFSIIAPVWLFFRLRDTSAQIAFMLLAVSLVLLPLNNVFRKHIEMLRKDYWFSLEDMSRHYLDGIRGMNTLKLFDRDREYAGVLAEKAETLNRNINKFMKVNFTSFLVSEGLIYGTIFLSMLTAVNRTVSGLMPLGSALTVLMLSYSYFGAIRQLMSATHNALTAVAAASGIDDLLAVDSSRAYVPDAPGDPQEYDGIRFDRVSFGYAGRKQALKDISMTIPHHKVTAFAGLSGCGKSTCAALMMRFQDPSGGHMYIEGRDYVSFMPDEIRQKVILVPQSVSIFSGTIRDNLLLAGPGAGEEELMEVLEQVRLADFVRSLDEGLDSDVGDAGSRLSGGQKQKIGIARALLSKAEYMIFDEATSSVDPESEREIQECIKELSLSRTLIIISHRLSAIEHADVIYVLDNGVVGEAGTHEELMKNNGLYHQLVSNQAELEAQVLL